MQNLYWFFLLPLLLAITLEFFHKEITGFLLSEGTFQSLRKFLYLVALFSLALILLYWQKGSSK